MLRRPKYPIAVMFLLMSLLWPSAFYAHPQLANAANADATAVNAPTPRNTAQTTTLPITGQPVPELAAFDQAMLNYMNARNIEAGVLAVMKDGVVVLERGYGWQDEAHTVHLPSDALMRIASVTKPITNAAIQKLIAAGQLAASDHVFCLDGNSSSCWLTLTPFGTPDGRLTDVTIQHLLAHRGGWDRTRSGDPMFNAINIAATLSVSSPPNQQDFARYMMGRPLDHTPGTVEAYSNFGYLLLGLIIEEVTGQDYTIYVQNQIFAPLGIANTEIELGRTLPANRNPREPWYDSVLTQPSVYPPHNEVPRPDGAWHLEAMEAHGGLISTSRALLEFGQAYWFNGIPRVNDGQYWYAIGSLDGTYSMLYWHPDGTNVAVIVNSRDHGPSHLNIKDEMAAVIESIETWPTTEPMPLMATYTVNSLADTVSAGDGDCTLREAINNMRAGSDTTNGDCAPEPSDNNIINLPAGTIILTGAANDDANLSGDLDVNQSVFINGHADGTIISGGSDGITITDRVFDISGADSVVLHNLTVTNGRINDDSGGIRSVDSNLTLANSTVSGNAAMGDRGFAGGILNLAINRSSVLALIDSTVADNNALGGSCGGIYNFSSANLATTTVDRSTVAGNVAPSGDGGGICNYAEPNHTALLDLTNSTVSGNHAGGVGGGIWNQSELDLINSTVTANSGVNGGGVANLGTSLLTNSIVANQTSGSDCGSIPVESVGYNLDSDSSCGLSPSSDLSGSNANLGLLQDNGGPSLTHALLAGSAAIDAGNCYDGTTMIDQRSVARPQGAACDIGAVELELLGQPPVAIDDAYTTQEGTPLNLSAPGVLGNDSDSDMDQLAAILVDDASAGDLTLNPDGSFTYLPNMGFTGVDTFTYQAHDGFEGSNVATVNITVEMPASGPTCAGIPATIVGTAKNDTLIGTSGNDVIVGRKGNDRIEGKGGDDLICGGKGKDLLIGGHGDDTLHGGVGSDELRGNTGHDTLYGGKNADKLFGGKDNDLLHGNRGADKLNGGQGHDTLRGGRGADKLHGDQGDDQLFGGQGHDLCRGGSGNDTIDSCEGVSSAAVDEPDLEPDLNNSIFLPMITID